MSVILTANLDVFQVKRLGMPMRRPHLAQCRVCRLVRIGNSLKSVGHQLVHLRDILITRPSALARHTAIDHIDRFGTQILTQLEILMISHTIGRTISPDIPERTAGSDITHCLTPDRIGSGGIALHKAASRETNETGMQRVEHCR